MTSRLRRLIFPSRNKGRDEENPLNPREGNPQHSDDLLKAVLKIEDLDTDGFRKHTEAYFHPYLNFLLRNLDETPSELLSVLEPDYTQANGAVLQPHAAKTSDPTEKQSSAIEESSEELTKASTRCPTVWYKLLTQMVLVLRDFHDSSIRGPEIHAIQNHLVSEGIMKADADAEEAAQLILRVFGWTTMFFEPPSEYTKNVFRPSKVESKSPQPTLRKTHTWVPHDIDLPMYQKHPVVDIMYHMLRENPFPRPLSSTSKALVGSNLSYYTLSKLAGLKIEWVESLCLHLELNKSDRTLKVFRFPSFCRLLCFAPSENKTFIQSMFESCLALEDDDGERQRGRHLTSQDYLQEILYTYTIIFSRDRFSRKAFAKDQKKQRIKLPQESPDPLLKRLCTTDSLKESSPDLHYGDLKLSYSPEEDFPFFAKRLSVLQEYTLSQAPNDWKTLWQDRRNPKEFYAFWAALIFGVSAILLAFIQVIGMIVQIYAQYQGNQSASRSS